MEKRIEIIAGTSIDDAYRQICEESSRCGVVVVCVGFNVARYGRIRKENLLSLHCAL